MEQYNIKGLSLAIIRDGSPFLVKYYGTQNVATDKKNDEHTVYKAASVGKPVFAYIVVKLAKEGKIDLDTPMVTYYDHDVVEDSPYSKEVTARMILSHTSGLPNFNEGLSKLNFVFAPGTNFKYSGYGYIYLQKVVESITGEPLEKLARKKVFEPLNMRDTSYVWQEKFGIRLADSYRGNGKKSVSSNRPKKAFSAWSLFTTLSDYSVFVAHIINSSKEPGSTAEKLLEPSVVVTDEIHWGLGWGLQNTYPNPSFWHLGSISGFRHFVVAYPAEGLAVVFMSNTSTSFKIVVDVMTTSIGGRYPSYDWF
jgi:CubicO group peptidase (beta-lactamase class C family)